MAGKQILYESYHLGTKLNPIVNLDTLGSKLAKLLKPLGYDVPDVDKYAKESLIIAAPIMTTIGTKNDTKIQLNFAANAINVVGQDPKNVDEIFNELLSLIKKIDYDLESIVVLHEAVANILIKNISDPQEKLNQLIKIKSDTLHKFGYILENTGLQFRYHSGKKDSLNIIIQPNPLNPKESIAVQLIFRPTDIKNLKDFNLEIEKILLEILSSMGV